MRWFAPGRHDPQVATALYCAVSTDTGCFVYNNTTANTHRVAAALIEAGCDVQGVNKRHFRTKSQARIALESAICQLWSTMTAAALPWSPCLRRCCAASAPGRTMPRNRLYGRRNRRRGLCLNDP